MPFSYLLGEWVMNLQGLMYAQNIENQNPVGAQIPQWGQGGHVNLGDAVPAKPDWQGGQPPHAIERPVMTGFLPTLYPAQGQDQNAGFYPYAELGRVSFGLEQPAVFPPTSGLVSGSLMINTGGILPTEMDRATFTGGYKFQPGSARDGVFSIQLDALRNHLWDYLFTIFSADEISVISGNRFPRPAVLSGTLRRIAAYQGYQPFPIDHQKPW